MATIVLTLVGNIVAGPVGGAIGAAIGQQIDQRVLFKPKGRQGPRLGDLSIQTSQYGAEIPKIFGTMRASGSVIWATDLREERRKVSAGKNQPKTTVFSYSASFAVALSTRRIGRIGRIWADGKLFRGAAGDFKTPATMRVYVGDEGQPLDPLIAATEGALLTPAYRGLAYVVLQDFQLAEYGNRIPSLSFEVIADEAPVSVGAIITDLTSRRVAADCPTLLNGFAASGDAVRGTVETLGRVIPLSVQSSATGLIVQETKNTFELIATKELGATRGASAAPRINVEQKPSTLLPEVLSLSYYDTERDFQVGLQRGKRDANARREDQEELPAALSPQLAKQLVERQLAYRWASRKRARVSLPWRFFNIGPGDMIRLESGSESWRVMATSFERMMVRLDLVRSAAISPVISAASPGRPVVQPDLVHGPTTLVLMDLPALGDVAATKPLVAIAAAGISSGWRGAALSTSVDEGASWQEAGTTAAPALIGTARTVLGISTANLRDMQNQVEVELLHPAMSLSNADATAILNGRNLAMLGAELIQFGRATLIAPGRYRLTDLLRGRRGTESAIAAHGPNEQFVMIDADALVLPDIAVGTPSLRVMATGIGDAGMAVEKRINDPRRALLPLMPSHVVGSRGNDGSLTFRWKRKSREGWRWIDGVDAPLAEERELYRLVATPNIGTEIASESALSEWTLSNTARAAMVSQGATIVTLKVQQIGTFGVSPDASITFPLI